jgi:hypothetical protein
MLEVRVRFSEHDGKRLVDIYRPFYSFGVGIVLALTLVSHFFVNPDIIGVLLWGFALFAHIFKAEEKWAVSAGGVVISHGFWKLRFVEEFRRDDISRVQVSTSKNCESRGAVGFYAPLNLTILKRRRDFMHGASGADAEIVATWLKGA